MRLSRRHVQELGGGGGGRYASQVRPVRPPCTGGWCAGQATMCWEGGAPVRPPCAGEGVRQARPVRPLCAGGVVCRSGEAVSWEVCWSGEAGQTTMCWGGGALVRRGRSSHQGCCAGQARSVRP